MVDPFDTQRKQGKDMARIEVGSYYTTHDGRQLRRASVGQRQRRLLKRQAHYLIHLLPPSSKYRKAAFCSIQIAHTYLERYRTAKAQIARIATEGVMLSDQAFLALIRRCGDDRAYLNGLLASARYYLAEAAIFGKRHFGALSH